jgi:predicted AlkP superfamily phosphohydrolase/phosphomutase
MAKSTHASALRAQRRQSSEGWATVAMALVPGAVAGTQIAGLLVFLNPDLPFAAPTLLRAILVYGTLWGLVGLALILPFTWGRVQAARRLLPWTIALVLAGSAFSYWYHASHLSYYMPPGINTRLIKAAAGLTVTALIGFYTALLHSLHDRDYGWRSRALLMLLVLASVYIMVERREAFRPQQEPVPREAQIERQLRPTLWVVGIEGATLDALLPLIQQGRLPFFASLLETGAYGRLESFAPKRSPSLWTSLSTGKLPYRHGVLDNRIYGTPFLASGGELRLTPVAADLTCWGMLGAPVRRVDSETSEVLALWQVLTRLDMRVGMVGWPLTDPLTDEMTFAFSDRFFEGSFGRTNAAPKELGERGTLFRPKADEIDTTQILGPNTTLLVPVQSALQQDLWRESLAAFLLDQEPDVDAVFLHLPGLDRVSHAFFGAFYAVQFEGKQDADLQAAAEYVIRYYEHLDRVLGELAGRLREPHVLAVVSVNGVEAPRGWGSLPNRMIEENRWRGTSVNSPDGIVLLSGRGIKQAEFLGSPRLEDVLPTLLYALDLPISRDLDGRVLTEAFEGSFLANQPLTFVPSYEALDESPAPSVPGAVEPNPSVSEPAASDPSDHASIESES